MKKYLPAIILLMLGNLGAMPVMAQNWNFDLEPYLQAISIKGDARMGRFLGADVDVNFDDILENLDGALMIHAELYNDDWGVTLDYGYMDLASDNTLPQGGVIAGKIRQGILEGTIFKRIGSRDDYVDLFAGFRWWDNDIDISIDPAILPGSANLAFEEDWTDILLGARVQKQLSQKWFFYGRADGGGAGIGSDFTATLAGGLRWQFMQSAMLDLQYKAVWVDYEAGSKLQPDYFNYDTVTHGPLVGLIFKF